MAKYRKKPIVVEVIQYKGYNSLPLVKKLMGNEFEKVLFKPISEKLIISTLEGDHEASVGDYIIKGVQGEFYPCKPDIFEMTYELVDDMFESEDKLEMIE